MASCSAQGRDEVINDAIGTNASLNGILATPWMHPDQ